MIVPGSLVRWNEHAQRFWDHDDSVGIVIAYEHERPERLSKVTLLIAWSNGRLAKTAFFRVDEA